MVDVMVHLPREASVLPLDPSLAWTASWAPGGPAQALHYCRAGVELAAIPGRYSVTYAILQDRQALLVDVGSRSDLDRIRFVLEHLQVQRVRFVMPTHLHFDHAMGVEAAADAFDAPVLLGSESRRRVLHGEPVPWPARWGPVLAVPGWVMQGMPTFPTSDWRHGLGFGFPWSRNRFRAPLGPPLENDAAVPGFEGWRVIDTPGHSPDSICLHHAGAGVLIAGDCVRNYRGGEWNGLMNDPEAYRCTRRDLLELDPRAIGPGHGAMLFGKNVLSGLREPTLRPW